MNKEKQLTNHLSNNLSKFDINLEIINLNIYIKYKKNNLIEIIRFLKNDEKSNFLQLVDITAIDYPNKTKRFEIVYIFLSHKYNNRLILKSEIEDNESIDSICEIYSSANWYERECYDLFGITFNNHPDLRRIMTDYGFVGHPLRKDFPLTGHTEVRYDELEKKVVYEPVKLQQDFRNFDFSSPWEGIESEVFKNEKNLEKKDETE